LGGLFGVQCNNLAYWAYILDTEKCPVNAVSED
jgi:hypothetical protein